MWPTGIKPVVINTTYPVLALGIANFTYASEDGSLAIDRAHICTSDICKRDYNVSITAGVSRNELDHIHYGTKFMIRSEDIGTKSFFPSVDIVNDSTITLPLHCRSADNTVEGLQFAAKSFHDPSGYTTTDYTVFFDESHMAFCSANGSPTD